MSYVLLRRAIVLLAVLSILAAGCSDSSTPADPVAQEPAETTAAETTPAETTAAPEPTPPPAPAAPEPPPAPPAAPEPPPPPPPAAPEPDPAAPEDDKVDTGAEDAMSEAMGGVDAPSGDPYASFTRISDDTGAIEVEVPSEWADIDGRPYTDEQGRQLFDVIATTDVATYLETYDIPGIRVTASREVAQTENEVSLLDESLEVFGADCTYTGRQPYSDELYTGQIDLYESCLDSDTEVLVLGAVPDSRAFVIRMEVLVVGERDVDAAVRALETFVIVGDV